MKSEKNNQPKKKAIRHDWDSLKKEYLSGAWLTVRQFLRDKNISIKNGNMVTGWYREKKELEKEVAIAAKKKLVQSDTLDIVKTRERQVRLARFLQLKGAKVLEGKDLVMTPDDARKMVVSGLSEERKAFEVGQSGDKGTSLTQINVNMPKTNLDKLVETLDYEGILKLIAELKRERTRRALPTATSDSTGKIEEGETL